MDVAGPEWRRRVDGLSTLVTAWTGNDTCVLELGEDEAERRLEGGGPVLADVRSHGIVLYGQEGYPRARPRKQRGGRG